jgi:hypothetical protein
MLSLRLTVRFLVVGCSLLLVGLWGWSFVIIPGWFGSGGGGAAFL